ncbi:hypothetical protein [Nocardioides ferulae]|uniref:hypothetical protein n=1 Tax=Nocardioides ferulae TaxID=2340821 RepID=UPI000F88ED1B|nr:hypothetical protein [Nocardioides ferulae]
MRIYRRCWLVVAGAVLGVGVAAGLSTLTWQSGLALVLPLAGLGALYGFLWAPFLPGIRRPALDGALLGATAGPALVGIFGLLGPIAALLLGMLFLAHPASLPWLTGRGRRAANPAGAIADRSTTGVPARAATADRRAAPVAAGRIDFGKDADSVRAALRSASDDELRQAWLTTNDSLGFSRSPDRAMELAQVRALVLDEFEIRDPASFQNWLWAAPRPSAGPALHGRHRHSSGR